GFFFCQVDSKSPGRFRAELEKVKLMQKEKGHE
ncbi:DUF2740 family protein, partial [Salmonella enterica]